MSRILKHYNAVLYADSIPGVPTRLALRQHTERNVGPLCAHGHRCEVDPSWKRLFAAVKVSRIDTKGIDEEDKERSQ